MTPQLLQVRSLFAFESESSVCSTSSSLPELPSSLLLTLALFCELELLLLLLLVELLRMRRKTQRRWRR